MKNYKDIMDSWVRLREERVCALQAGGVGGADGASVDRLLRKVGFGVLGAGELALPGLRAGAHQGQGERLLLPERSAQGLVVDAGSALFLVRSGGGATAGGHYWLEISEVSPNTSAAFLARDTRLEPGKSAHSTGLNDNAWRVHLPCGLAELGGGSAAPALQYIVKDAEIHIFVVLANSVAYKLSLRERSANSAASAGGAVAALAAQGLELVLQGAVFLDPATHTGGQTGQAALGDAPSATQPWAIGGFTPLDSDVLCFGTSLGLRVVRFAPGAAPGMHVQVQVLPTAPVDALVVDPAARSVVTKISNLFGSSSDNKKKGSPSYLAVELVRATNCLVTFSDDLVVRAWRYEANYLKLMHQVTVSELGAVLGDAA